MIGVRRFRKAKRDRTTAVPLRKGVIMRAMRLRLDPWAADYHTAFQADAPEPPRPARTDLESPTGDWRPIRPDTAPPFDELIFLDGGRRVDARVLLEDDRQQVAFGALGAYGVGSVHCTTGARARIGELHVEHLCALSSGMQHADFRIAPGPSGLGGALNYRVVSTPERDVDSVVRRLQQEMLSAEGRSAARLAPDGPGALIVCDGPRPLLSGEPRVVGYVKTIHQVRLPEHLMAVVRRLEASERSPLYLVEGDDPRHSYFEWFLRLRDPRPWLYSLAGMVRLQALAGPRPEERLDGARGLADWSCLQLPRYASRQHQDPRAPQQLLPVRALEGQLRRRMGDTLLVRRRITRFLSGQGGVA
jgi:hypothetical protein